MDLGQLADPTAWLSILKIAFGASVGTAFVQGGYTLWRDHSTKRDRGAYLALRLAVMLEAYCSECCSAYFDNANAHHDPDEPYPNWRTELPKLPEFPDDVEAWRALDKMLLAKCLDFPNRVHASQNAIASCVEYDMHDLELALDEHISDRGVEAWEIASALRDACKLERADIVFDHFSVLKDARKSSKERREGHEASQAKLIQALGMPRAGGPPVAASQS
jgi:hypothetical protein